MQSQSLVFFIIQTKIDLVFADLGYFLPDFVRFNQMVRN